MHKKIETILNDINKFMVEHDYLFIEIENNQIEIDDYDNIKNLIINIYDNLKMMDFSNIEKFEIKCYENDDFYVLLLYDNKKQIINKLFWDYDFNVYQNDLEYECMENFNINEWF